MDPQATWDLFLKLCHEGDRIGASWVLDERTASLLLKLSKTYLSGYERNIMQKHIVEAILTIINHNSKVSLSRDCECIQTLRDLLITDDYIQQVDLYTCVSKNRKNKTMTKTTTAYDKADVAEAKATWTKATQSYAKTTDAANAADEAHFAANVAADEAAEVVNNTKITFAKAKDTYIKAKAAYAKTTDIVMAADEAHFAADEANFTAEVVADEAAEVAKITYAKASEATTK